MMTIITGNIASGKSTLMRKLIEYGYKQVLEHTTRPPRKGEKNHVDYHFIEDAEFDRLEGERKFVETLHAQTMYGVWKYGLLEDSMLDDGVIVIGSQSGQVLESGHKVLLVMLDISEADAWERIKGRGDSAEEFMRRFRKDQPAFEKLWEEADLVLDATASVEDNAMKIMNYVHTAQKMTPQEKAMYLEGGQGLRPYLRMRGKGMPVEKVDQIAWLLLQGAGCGFCKVCREEPCGIKDGEKCTKNIADYIRECVHEEDRMKKGGKDNGI